MLRLQSTLSGVRAVTQSLQRGLFGAPRPQLKVEEDYDQYDDASLQPPVDANAAFERQELTSFDYMLEYMNREKLREDPDKGLNALLDMDAAQTDATQMPPSSTLQEPFRLFYRTLDDKVISVSISNPDDQQQFLEAVGVAAEDKSQDVLAAEIGARIKDKTLSEWTTRLHDVGVAVLTIN